MGGREVEFGSIMVSLSPRTKFSMIRTLLSILRLLTQCHDRNTIHSILQRLLLMPHLIPSIEA